MTAAEKKVVLEYGSDYLLQLKIKDDDGINNRDVRNWTWQFKIYNATTAVQVGTTFSGTIPDNDDSLNGTVDILIDSGSVTVDTYPTLVTGDDPFATQFNYFYTLTLVEDGATPKREMRVLRGKLAVRL